MFYYLLLMEPLKVINEKEIIRRIKLSIKDNNIISINNFEIYNLSIGGQIEISVESEQPVEVGKQFTVFNDDDTWAFVKIVKVDPIISL